ncbi:SLBB domain-containing protein [Bacteroidota bacterium]
MKKINWLIFFVFLPLILSAQVKDYELGVPQFGSAQRQGGFFDYSDPASVNIKVSVWGNVNFPGRYSVPIYTTVADLISLAGGPTDDAELDDLRIYRTYEDSSEILLKFSYDDLLWESYLGTEKRYIPDLTAGDILLIPGSPRYYFRETFSFVLSVMSTLISIAILALTLFK